MKTVGTSRALSLDSVVVASSQQVSCDVAGEAVLLSMRDGEYYGLNEVAASIWRLVQQPRTPLQIRNALLEEYEGISASECEHAVAAFLTEMFALNLIDVF
jgi:hypothetical protein